MLSRWCQRTSTTEPRPIDSSSSSADVSNTVFPVSRTIGIPAEFGLARDTWELARYRPHNLYVQQACEQQLAWPPASRSDQQVHAGLWTPPGDPPLLVPKTIVVSVRSCRAYPRRRRTQTLRWPALHFCAGQAQDDTLRGRAPGARFVGGIDGLGLLDSIPLHTSRTAGDAQPMATELTKAYHPPCKNCHAALASSLVIRTL